MDNDHSTGVTQEPSDAAPLVPRFNHVEERQIAVGLEIQRRLQASLSLDEPDDSRQLVVENIGVYPPEKRHFLSFVIKEWGQIIGLLLLVITHKALAAIVSAKFFGIEFGSRQSAIVMLAATVVTFFIVTTVILLELQKFMYWRNWTLTVTETEVILQQRSSIIGRLSETSQSLRRRSVEYIKVKRKWYLWFLDAWTVSFDAPSDEDADFHDLHFIRKGKLLRTLFAERKD